MQYLLTNFSVPSRLLSAEKSKVNHGKLNYAIEADTQMTTK